MEKSEKKTKETPAKEVSVAPIIAEQPVESKIETKQVLVNVDHVYQIGEEYYPSVTTILSALAKGKGFEIWLQSHSQDESKDLLEEAGLAGSKIHHAIEQLLLGKRVVPSEFVYVDKDGVEHKGLTPEESFKLGTFIRWWFEYRPKLLAFEKIVYSEQRKYAGSLDFIGTIKEGLIDKKSKTPDKELMFVIDWKSSKGIYPSYEMQVAAYAQAEMEMTGKKVDRIAILRLGSKHKCGYEFRVMESIATPYKSFLGVMEAWKFQNPNFGPKIIDVPAYFQLPKIETVKVEEIKKKGKNNADSRTEQHSEAPKTGSDQAGDKGKKPKRARISKSAGLLPLPG